MKIAVLSDTRLPTNPTYPGHGLGQINLVVAEGLRQRGHDVTLFAGWGSAFGGELVTGYHESDFYRDNRLADFDAVLDGGHEHQAAKEYESDAPIVNVSHDREHHPGRNAVYVSAAHRSFWSDYTGRVIHNAVNLDAFPLRESDDGGYLAWLAHFHPAKGPRAAMQVAQLTGMPLKMAGPLGDIPFGAPHCGAVSGDEKIALLHGAKAAICPFGIESAGLVALEAAACGVPTIGFDLGGLPEYIEDDVTGFVVSSTEQMARAVARVGEIDREACRQWVAANRSMEAMISAYEQALRDVASGETW